MRPGTGGSSCWPLPAGNRGGGDLARDCPQATGLRGPRGSRLHVVQPSAHWGLSGSAVPKFYPTWNSLEVSGVSRLCPPTSYGFILEGPPISLTSHHCPLYCLTICVPPPSPRLPVPPCPLPSLVSWPPSPLQPAWAAAQSPCLAVLPGSPSAALSWPRPLLPSIPASDLPLDTGVECQHRPQGPRIDGSSSAPAEASPWP